MTIHKSGEGPRRRRIRRAPPVRTHPDRGWARVLRPGDSWNSSSSLAPPSKTAKAVADGAFDGVQAGYDLIENHIRRARTVAAQYGKERISKRPVDRSEEIKATVASVFRTLADLAPVIGGLINTIGAEGFAQALSGVNPLAVGSNGANFSSASARVIIELSSKRRTAASCDLRSGAERRRLSTSGLATRSGQRIGAEALTFAPAQGSKPAALRIRLPDDQASGIYGGLLFDQISSEPQGVVTIRVAR